MTTSAIRAALSVALNSISPTLSCAWENVAFTPVNGTPHQRINMLRAAPENPSIGAGMHREVGIMQVTLCYPLGAGPQPAEARAELIRAAFSRGASFTSGAATVHITTTPAVAAGYIEADRYCVPVSIRFHANLFP